VIGGRAQYGKPALMARAGRNGTSTTSLEVDGQARAMVLTKPDDPGATWEWDDVVARMEVVRKNPMREIEKGRTRQEAAMASVYQARSRNGGRAVPQPPLRLALDMPTGLTPLGGLPKNLDEITVPPLAGLSHDGEFLDSIVGRGYHGGVLDDLARFYR
jgi:hypothetical protein